MSLSDPIADMLTRIRNAASVGKSQVNVRRTNICEAITKVLQDEGFVKGYDCIEDGKQGVIRVALKYDVDGDSIIREIKRVSKPGCRVYTSVDDLPHVDSGMGIAVVSTSKGVMSDRNCRESKVGGEILCMVS